jgi:hypothetical protein
MRYLVDLGRLVPVSAVTPSDAFQLAILGLGCESHVDRAHCRVYELDQDGRVVIRVVHCELQGKEVAV